MRLTTTFAALMMTATSVFAQDVEMTDAERENFRAEVRAYLLENPEVLMEAIAVLENRQEQAEANRIDSTLEPGEIPADMLEGEGDEADAGEETAEG